MFKRISSIPNIDSDALPSLVFKDELNNLWKLYRRWIEFEKLLQQTWLGFNGRFQQFKSGLDLADGQQDGAIIIIKHGFVASFAPCHFYLLLRLLELTTHKKSRNQRIP